MSKTLWILKWREAPPYDAYEYEIYESKGAAIKHMKVSNLDFRGESLHLYRVEIGEPVASVAKKTGSKPT